MEEEDSKKIISNCDKLVKEINWPEIWPKLFEHGIYSKGNKKVQRWEKDLNDINNTREIYLTIIKRGPKAFENFIKCLKEIGRNDLANMLKDENNSTDQVDNNLEKEDEEIPHVIESGNSRNININNANNNNGNNHNNNNNVQRNDLQEGGESETAEEGGDENDDYYKRLQFTDTPLVIRVKKSTKFVERYSGKVPFYIMRSNPRGLVLIINNTKFSGLKKDRAAAEHDEKNLEELFRQMGFKVQTYGNLTKVQMLEEFERFSKQPELRHVHSMFVIVMSHGTQYKVDNISHSVVCGVDDQIIADTDIMEFFTTTACENMFNKPKVFIFQSCRGDKVQLATNPSNVSMGRDDTDVNQFVSDEMKLRDSQTRPISDLLVAYSTLPGYEALRDEVTGSWYIQTLCEVMMNHAHDTELYEMLLMADQRLSTLRSGWNLGGNLRCQTSSIWSIGFNKKCYLNPGYFGDSD